MQRLRLKLFALLIAILLWLIVTTDIRIATLSVPIEVQNLPTDRIMMSDFTQQATVKVSGPRFLVSEVLASPPLFLLQVPDDVGEHFTVNLSGDELSLPSAVRVLAIEPAELTIDFDKRLTRAVPVQVPIIGGVPEDYQIVSTEISPPRVEITGPQREVSRIDEIETVPVDLRRIVGDTTRELELRKPGVKTSVALSRVRWVVSVRPVEAVRSIRNVPVVVTGASSASLRIQPQSITILVRGRPSVVNELEVGGVSATIDADGVDLSKGGVQVPVVIEVPKGIELKKAIPASVGIVVRRQLPR